MRSWEFRWAVGRNGLALEAQRVLRLRRANPARRDWTRRACGPHVIREPVRSPGEIWKSSNIMAVN